MRREQERAKGITGTPLGVGNSRGIALEMDGDAGAADAPVDVIGEFAAQKVRFVRVAVLRKVVRMARRWMDMAGYSKGKERF